ncbi:hypothetical protein M9H77_30957 [Catharanthus roseus]|uniref:Uncharacterized protein n=1 Tax=Catharanthus roseus TaxID=4058 RepID=A0ACB9ZYP4_CATRO|nr:hypothetical protein M9H77_30957 [Catharanthus roseus]
MYTKHQGWSISNKDSSTRSAFRRISRLHCTWLVPHTKASSDDVDGFLTLRVDPLEEGRSTWRAWPNRLVPRGTQISYSAAVDLVAELGANHVFLVIAHRVVLVYIPKEKGELVPFDP